MSKCIRVECRGYILVLIHRWNRYVKTTVMLKVLQECLSRTLHSEITIVPSTLFLLCEGFIQRIVVCLVLFQRLEAQVCFSILGRV